MSSVECQNLMPRKRRRRETPSGLVSRGGLNPVIAATFGQILEPLRRHSQDAPGGVPVACRTPSRKSPEITPPAHLSNVITGNLAGDTPLNLLIHFASSRRPRRDLSRRAGSS